jgi:uncharacterized membrane protein YsdA (DUF1294 family)
MSALPASLIGLFLWLVLANAIGFGLMLADKRRARSRQRRIPERTLIGWSLLGGSAGTLAGSIVARHKTRKQPIAFLLRAIPVAQASLAAAWWWAGMPLPGAS